MFGDNCFVVGCGLCWKMKGIGIWKFLVLWNEVYKKWRFDWLN